MSDNMNNRVTSKNEERSGLKTLLKVLMYSRECLIMIIVAIVIASVASCLMIHGASKVSDIVDKIRDIIIEGASLSGIKKLAVYILVIYILYLILASFQGVFMASIKQKLIYKLRSDIERKRCRLSMASLRKGSTGNVLSIITNDVSKLSQSFSEIVVELIPAIVLFVGTLTVMMIKSWILTLAVIVSIILGFILIGLIMGRSQKYYTKQQNTLGRINDNIEETFGGLDIVKTYNGQQMVREKFDALNTEMRKANFRTFCFQSLLVPITILMNNLGYISICIIGVSLITKGKITYGVIASFMMYFTNIQDPINKIGASVQQVQTVIATSDRIFDYLDTEEMPSEDEKKSIHEPGNGEVEFKNIKFGYDPEKSMVIKDFSLKVNSGEKVAIVGHTGAGKTTLINLLLRFYDANSGDIIIGGRSIYDMKREDVREMFSVVPQDSWVFDGTLRENMVLDSSDICDEMLDKICRSVGIDYFVSMLPDGYDTIIDEKFGLSQGQKQQISIVRAMIANKKMLILDEATSSVDVLLEQKIQKAMDMLSANRTSFIIAHRLSTIKNADVIIVMKEGNVVESGSHSELLEKHGVYADLYYSQWSDEEIL